MSRNLEIPLGNACHTVDSDEPWYLVVESDAVRLEARFQVGRPQPNRLDADRTLRL